MDPWTKAVEEEEARRRALASLRIIAKNSDGEMGRVARLVLEEVADLQQRLRDCGYRISYLEERAPGERSAKG